jgi:hypothetical protein
MFKATRDLISARQKLSKFVIQKVTVDQLGGGNLNDCFNNSCTYKENNISSKVVSGWIVKKFDAKTNSTAIIQHYWNVTHDGQHVDTTPLIGNDFEYVIDIEIALFSQMNYDKIFECVCSSLLLSNGLYSTIKLTDDDVVTTPIKELNLESLFRDSIEKQSGILYA